MTSKIKIISNKEIHNKLIVESFEFIGVRLIWGLFQIRNFGSIPLFWVNIPLHLNYCIGNSLEINEPNDWLNAFSKVIWSIELKNFLNLTFMTRNCICNEFLKQFFLKTCFLVKFFSIYLMQIHSSCATDVNPNIM